MATLEARVHAVYRDFSAIEVVYPFLPYPTTLPNNGYTREMYAAVSDKPIWSKDYSTCVGVALVGKRFSALTHHSKLTGDPEVYLPLLIAQMKRVGETEIVSAVLGSILSSEHVEAVREALHTEHIPIIIELLEKNGISTNKVMVVLPRAQEVIAYSQIEGGYTQLMYDGHVPIRT